MPTLAPKLPYTHPFAGGYPRVGGQPLPTDPDAIDYLERVKAADGGAAVEVGVAMAVDAFIKGCKADGIWSALKASCILCGARTISGALVPLVGAAPTPYNFASGDYSRATGLAGDGATKYLDSNRAGNADGQDDHHLAAYISDVGTLASVYISNHDGTVTSGYRNLSTNKTSTYFFSATNSGEVAAVYAGGFVGLTRSASTSFSGRIQSADYGFARASTSQSAANLLVFRRTSPASSTDARLAFYSIGSAIPDLAALDTRVTQLVNGIKFHSLTGLVATDYDPDTVAYIVAAYEAGGTL